MAHRTLTECTTAGSGKVVISANDRQYPSDSVALTTQRRLAAAHVVHRLSHSSINWCAVFLDWSSEELVCRSKLPDWAAACWLLASGCLRSGSDLLGFAATCNSRMGRFIIEVNFRPFGQCLLPVPHVWAAHYQVSQGAIDRNGSCTTRGQMTAVQLSLQYCNTY